MMLSELMQIDTQCNRNYFAIFYNMRLELRIGTMTRSNKRHAQNDNSKKIFNDI